MTTAAAADRTVTRASRTQTAVWIVVLAGLGLVGYGLMFLMRNFTGFIELGLTPQHIGGTPEQIQSFNPQLYNYISHLQVAISGFIIAVGIAVVMLAWYGIRTGQRWAAWTAFVVPVVAVGIALPLHYTYGLATMGHLGLIYLDALILVAGTVLSLRALSAPEVDAQKAARY